MNSGPTTERVHDALKRRIMEHGFRPGERLDPALLADLLLSSTTPVREALNQLLGEGLVEARAGGGFHIPLLDEPGLHDLYDWSEALLLLAVRNWYEAGELAAGPRDAKPADRSAALFLAIAERSVNREHRRAIGQLNGRMHAVRCIEPHILGGVSEELDALGALLESTNRGALRKAIGAYHRRRRQVAAAIVRAAYRDP
ncbi:MAG: GntR family transcriptional regulator [Sphingomonas sp.]|uniref:GntR family transcriptional regulator n=1 Tax=Sphingomonas sp. TaxID=28214 RepID=UPI001B0D5FD5|nr:GntR family transcriptional regulator [Sphingomonas sp.]MBO9623959.1 GntR family transcriptional regulator [Sphingomonas sp.]